MNHPVVIITWLCVLCAAVEAAPDESREETLAKHQEGSVKVADDQDELSADVQQLVIEQTEPKVIALLDAVEVIMDEATDRLAKADTGGETIAAQTEIIEKIHAAAKQKQQSGKDGGSKSGGAMMDMMERMMEEGKGEGKMKGKGKGKGEGKGEGEGEGEGSKGGKGRTGLSDTGNDADGGNAGGMSEVRRVPKAAGSANLEIPEEFRNAFDAYNRGAEKKIK